MPLARHRVLRRFAVYGALVTLLGLTATALTQCTMVQDNVTGVTMSDVGPGRCIRECADAFNDSMKVEFLLNAKNRSKCGLDPVCQVIEKERHRQAMDRIKDWFRKCREDCHHQGGGHSR